jgi:peptide-methionine (S)-S-oxide reductase
MNEGTERAILAGGCFWIMQQLLRGREGVVSTRTGWIGGRNANPTEDDNDGHAEAVEVVFDPGRVSFRDVLEYFFQVHRADLGAEVVGSSYRSAIFHTSEEQRGVAEAMIRDVEASGHWPGTIVTEISEAGRFWVAEAPDQDYFQRFPHGCPPPFPRTGAEARESGEPEAAATTTR